MHRTWPSNFRTLVLALAGLACFELASCAPATVKSAPAKPDFSGFWEPDDKSKLPHDDAAFTKFAQDELAKAQAARKGQWIDRNSVYCLPAGMPFMMGTSEGFDIVQAKTEMVIISEERPSPRHVFLDGRGHPSPDIWDPTTVGHSTATWNGETLVVDTVAFRPGVAGGLVLTDTTKLEERYTLQNEGKQLKIDFTWNDPKTLEKPYTYSFVLNRGPADREAYEYYCDPSDPKRLKQAGSHL